MVINKWGIFPVVRPAVEFLEDGKRIALTAPWVWIQPARPDIKRPLRIHVARPQLESDGESKPFIYTLLPGVGGRYEGPGLRGALIHDEHCHTGRDLNACPYPSGEVHRAYYEAVRCSGLNAMRAEARWFGVRNAGPKFNANPKVKENTLEDLQHLAPVAFANLAAACEAAFGLGLNLETLELLIARS